MFNKKINSAFYFQYRYLIVAFLILLLAFFVRFYRLGQVPISLYWDETAMLVDAKSVAETGQDMQGHDWLQPLFVSYGDYKLPVYIWLTSVAVKVFGVSEWTLRLPSAIAGVFKVIIVGLLAREMVWDRKTGKSENGFVRQMGTWRRSLLNRLAGKQSESGQMSNVQGQMFPLITMLVLAISPWSFLFSRTGFEGHVGQMLMSLSVLLMFYGRRWKWSYLISSLIGALAVYTYYSVRFVWPVVFITYLLITYLPMIFQQTKSTNILQSLSSKFKSKSSRRSSSYSPIFQFSDLIIVVASLVLWCFLLIPMYQSPYYSASQTFRLSTTSIINTDEWILQSNSYREIAGNGIFSRIFYHRYWLTFRELLKNYADHFDPNYLFVHGDDNLRHSTGKTGLLVLGFAPFLITGFYGLARKRSGVLLLLTVWWLIALLPASVPQDTPHALRSLNALTPMVLIVSYGLYHMLQYLLNTTHLQLKLYLSGLFIALATLIIVQTGVFYHDYFTHYEHRSAGEWQSGYKALAYIIRERQADVRTVWVNAGDDRFYLWVMLYGEYSANDYHKWQFINDQVKSIENIEFKPFNWGELERLDHKILVVETPGRLQGDPIVKYEIKDWSGKPRFEIGEYGGN